MYQFYDDEGYTIDPDNGKFLLSSEQYVPFDFAKPRNRTNLVTTVWCTPLRGLVFTTIKYKNVVS